MKLFYKMVQDKTKKQGLFLPNSRRGLSTVVTSLIIILLVLVAVGIVWIVVKNIISEGAEQVALGKLTMNLEIKKVTVNDGSVDVQVKRNSGAGELSGIKFIVSDGINTQVFEEATTMAELGTRSFTLAYSGLVKEISIAPIFETESGKEFTGNEIDKFEFSNVEMITNMNGLISWWRFEGDATDEVGENDGNISGANCNADGKYGRACEFDGVNDYVDCGDDTVFNIQTSVTVVAWAYIKELNDYQDIVGKGGFSGGFYNNPYVLGIFTSGNQVSFLSTNSSADSYFLISTPISEVNKWYHLIGVIDVNTNSISIYKDGVLVNSNPYYGNILVNSQKVHIGSAGFNGTIDEVMIFNKALSEDEVKALYELDLS